MSETSNQDNAVAAPESQESFEAPMLEDGAQSEQEDQERKPIKQPRADEQTKQSPDDFKWYVVQVFSGMEQRVQQALTESIKVHHLDNDFGQILVPREKIKEIKDGKKRESERKFFPGYVLIQMRMRPETWQLVKHTDRVLAFVGGSSDKPLPISDAEAERIITKLRESNDQPRPKTIFEIGESVRVTDGAFKDFVGTVERVDYEKNRVTVSIQIFGRATPVDLEFSQIEKDL